MNVATIGATKRCSELDWELTMLATDGSTLDDVPRREIDRVRPVGSAGGFGGHRFRKEALIYWDLTTRGRMA